MTSAASSVSSSLATSPGNSLASATTSSLTTILTTQTYPMASQGSSNIPGASITHPDAYSKAKESVISFVNQFVSNLISQAAESAPATGLTTGLTTGMGKETGMPKGEKIGLGIGSAVIGLVVFGILGYFLIRRSRTHERSRFLSRSDKIRDHAPQQSTPNPYSGSVERPRSAFDNEEDEDFGFYGNEPGHSDAVELERRYRQDSTSAPTGVWRNEPF
ncbi:BZ3500_MvSof-1268-A1-R1_Chr2-1g04108 [Microbotryum saponariae]|uniref:BZ3500_MvSof-1268-A1-R1_Chr2-1g04108 protein n=1 Tax=Microbotryum saponariae TaxID=289078 RepID=A0A2X0MHP6_9BASI|nr:BZ3500_MvSof-1268-A1-R1_Chr2-1g04108 [Microbotryum saponariae]SCZ91095.1 BZ3501_MvSof-1269-A2-R1_Chr2-1g03764 [Microbotryum saponariae]